MKAHKFEGDEYTVQFTLKVSAAEEYIYDKSKKKL